MGKNMIRESAAAGARFIGDKGKSSDFPNDEFLDAEAEFFYG